MTKSKNYGLNRNFLNAIFLVQVGYNDFDHMLPVINKLSNIYKKRIIIDVIYDVKSISFPKNDHRFVYLKSLSNVRINYTFKYKRILKLYDIFNKSDNLLFKVISEYLRRYIRFIIKDPQNFDWLEILSDNFLNYNRTIIFVGMTTKRTNYICNILKSINPRLKTVLLPHGTELYTNQMTYPEDLSSEKQPRDFSHMSDMDYLFFTDNYTKKQALDYGLNNNQIKVVGSARFCLEWINKSKILGINGPLPKIGKNRIKVLFLMPHYATNIFMEEVYRTLLFISQYKEICLIAVTRVGASLKKEIPVEIINNLRINFVDKEFTSSALIDWSNVLIHCTSTMQYDGYQRRKIVVFPRYLLASSTLCEKYQAGIILSNRDELRDNVNSMIESYDQYKKNYFLNSSGIKNYIHDYVNGGNDISVLDKYLNEINKII